jgi:cysteine synthase B
MHGIEGLKHMETALVPGIYDAGLADRDLRVDTDAAVVMTRRLAREEGLFVGISAGANVAAALAVAEPPAVVVTVLCDGGARYLSDPLWEVS